MATQIGQLKYSVGFDIKKQDLNALKASLQQIKQLSLSDLMKINQSDRATATRTFTQIREQAEYVEKAIKEAFNVKLNTTNIETFNKSLDKSGTSLQKVYNTFKQGGVVGQNAFRSLVTQVTTANTQLKQTHKFLDNIATTLGNTIKWNVASSAINTLSNSIQQAWGYVKSLDTSLNDIRIVTGKSADQMAKFSEQANVAAQSLGKTTVDYTKAALIYAQQGLSDEDIATRAAITLKTANVTGQSTDAVSEQLTSVWNGYKVSAEEAELYIDRLAAVAATTASDLEQLSTGMSKVAAAAAAMGVGQDQLAAQLSTIISVTRQAPESVGTALRTVYARISDIRAGLDEDGVTLGNYSGKMAELGFKVLDVNDNLRDMGEVIEEIGGRWSTLSREQQVSLAQTMAGQRQYSNLIALFDNFDKYTEALHTAQNAAGTLQKQQDTYMEGTRAHLNQLKAATENLYDSLVNADSIEPLIDGLTKVTNLAAKFVDALGGGGNVLLALGGIAANVFSKQLTSGIETFVHNLKLASIQAQDVELRIKMLQDTANNPNLSEGSKKLFNDYADMMKQVAPTATDQEFKMLQRSMQQSTQFYNNIQSQINNINKESEQYSSIQVRLGDEYQDFLKLLNTSKEEQTGIYQQLTQQQEAEETHLNNFSNNLDQINQKLIERTEIQAKLQNTNLSDQQRNNLQQQRAQLIESTNQEINKQILLLEQLKNQPGFSNQKEEIDNLIISFNTLKDASLNSTEYTAGINNIKDSLSQVFGLTQEEVETFIRFLEQSKTKIDILNQGAQDLGNKNKKFLESFINQKKIQGIGKLAGSFTQLSSAIGITSNAFNELRKGNLGSGLTGLATSLTSVTTAAISAGKAVQALGASIGLASGIGAASAIISLLVSGFVAYKQAVEQAKQAQIDFNNSIIQQENKKQEQIEQEQQLLISIQKLNKQYEQGQITRKDLRDEISRLTEQYGVEQDYIDKLIYKYGNLTDAIRQARLQAVKEQQASLQRQLDASNKNLQVQYSGKKFTERPFINSFEFDTEIAQYSKEYTQFTSLLNSFGGESSMTNLGGFHALHVTLPEDIKQLESLYDKLQQEKLKYPDMLYSFVQKILTQIEQDIEYNKDLQNKLDNINLSQSLLSNFKSDFSDIKSLEEYQQQRNALIQELIKEQHTTRDIATKAVDTELKNTSTELYNKYTDAIKYYDNLTARFGKDNPQILKTLDKLSSAQLDLLQKEDFDKGFVKSWSDLERIIEKISNYDLSNLDKVTELDNADVDVASDKYNYYQSLEDQVRSGKSISKTTMKDLQPELQSYFSKMANGSYKMVGDAEEFYQKVNSLKLDGFFNSIANINKQIEKNIDLQLYLQDVQKDSQFDFNNLNKEAYSYQSTSNLQDKLDKLGLTTLDPQVPQKYVEIQYDLVQQQLKYLDAVAGSNQELKSSLQTWHELADAQHLSKQQVVDIANAIAETEGETDNLTEKAEGLTEELKRAEQQLYDAMFPTDVDIDQTALAQMTNTIQQLATKSDELAPSLDSNARAANEIAQAVLRFDDAIQDVVDNYDNWILALNEGNLALGDQAVMLPQLRDAYADMLDLDGSLLTNEFLLSAQNLELMKAAIDGDIDAYEKLAEAARVAAIQALKLDPSIKMEHFEEDIQYLKNYLNTEKDFLKLEVGAELNDQEFLDGLSNMLNFMGVSAQQASDILRQNLGIDAEIIQQKVESEQTQRQVGFNANFQPVTASFSAPLIDQKGRVRYQDGTYTAQSLGYEPVMQSATVAKENSAFTLKVTTAHKSAGGNFKYTHASRGAGSAGIKRRTEAAQKAAKAAKTSEPKLDTSTKETKSGKQDDRDIYHDINLQLEQINRQLSRAQKIQERLFGKQLIANLNKQSQILEQHKAKLREKQKLQQLDLAQKAEQLRLLGVIVNTQTGNIDNYLDALGQRQGVINGLIAQYNSVVGSYNATTDKQAKDVIKDQLTEIERAIKDAETDYKNLESKIKNYDSLRKAYEDISDQIEEQTQKQIEIQITKFNMQVEIRLNMGQAERDWNKFKREVLEGTDVLKDTNFSKIYKDANLNYKDIYSYFDINGNNKGQIQTLTKQINETIAEINQINQTGISDIYGDNKAKALEDLQKHLSTIQESMTDVKNLIDEIDEAYLETYDDIKDQMQKQIDDYEFVNDLIEHDMDLLQLLYGDKQYDAMNSYYMQEHANQLNQIDFLRQAAALVKERWQMEEAAGNINAAEKLKEQYKNLINDLNSLVEASVKTLQDKYENAISQIFDTLDRRVTNGLGLQYVDMEWQLLNKNAEEYLDAINSAYALQELETKFQKAIDSTDNVKNQKAISSLMDQQLSKLRAKNKLTQYDIDRAAKLLEIQQARMELEERRTAKTSLRLKRDSQGNYSYVYTANEEEVEEVEDNLAKLQNELYNFDKQAYKDNLNDVLSAYKEFTQRYKQIYTDRNLDQADKEKLLALLIEQYQEYITGKTEENYVIRQNLASSAFDSYAELYDEDYNRFANMVESERDVFLGELVAGWNSGVQQMIEAFIGAGGLQEICTETFGELERVTKQYQSDLSDLQKAAGEDFGRIRQGAINPTTDAFKELMTANDDLIRQFQNQLTDIENLRAALENLKNAYNDVWDAAMRAAEAAQQVLQKEREVAAQEAQNAARSKPQPVPEQKVSLPETPQVTTPAPVNTPTPMVEPVSAPAAQVETPKVEETKQEVKTTKKKPMTLAEGLAGAIWHGLWGSKIKEVVNDYMVEIMGVNQGTTNFQKAWKIYSTPKYSPDPPFYSNYYEYGYDYYKKLLKTRSRDSLFPTTMATGGYTGEWGSEGRLAVLHQKELVLNAQDTKNMLDSVEVLRGIVANLGGSISARLNGLNSGYAGASPSQTSSQVDQNVSIQANFPNVNSKREIEEAFSELVNLAAQRAMRRA